MSSAFVPLATFLRPVAQAAANETPAAVAAERTEPVAAQEYAEVLRAMRRFHAGLSDALDAAVQDLLKSIAREVIGRELRLGPMKIAAIVDAALNRFREEKVVAVRAHPADLKALDDVDLERIGDHSLQPGDLRLELRSGTIDLTLSARLEAVLASCSP